MYQNIRVQFSAPFWYRWPNFRPLAHGLSASLLLWPTHLSIFHALSCNWIGNLQRCKKISEGLSRQLIQDCNMTFIIWCLFMTEISNPLCTYSLVGEHKKNQLIQDVQVVKKANLMTKEMNSESILCTFWESSIHSLSFNLLPVIKRKRNSYSINGAI